MLSIVIWPANLVAQAQSRSLKKSDVIDLSCLSRQQKEFIDECFDQNTQCHRDLQTVSTIASQESSDWEYFVGAILLGGIGGWIIAVQTRH